MVPVADLSVPAVHVMYFLIPMANVTVPVVGTNVEESEDR